MVVGNLALQFGDGPFVEVAAAALFNGALAFVGVTLLPHGQPGVDRADASAGALS